MSMFTITLSGESTHKTFVTRFRGAFHAFRTYREHRIATRNLEAMEDFLLKDIGISRTEISAAVSGSAAIRRLAHERVAD